MACEFDSRSGHKEKRALLLFFDLFQDSWDFLKILGEKGAGLAVDTGGGGMMEGEKFHFSNFFNIYF